MPAAPYHAVSLPLGGGPIEVLDDTEVFLVSPRTKREQRKQKKQARARASSEPHRLAAVGLSRIESVPTTPAKRSSSASSDSAGIAEEAAFGSLGVGLSSHEVGLSSHDPSLCSEPTRGRTQSGWSSVAESIPEGSDASSETDSDDDAYVSEDPLDDGIKRRAGEQMMVQNLKLLAVKYRQYGTAPRSALAGAEGEAETESPGRARRQARDAAENFNVTYGRTLGILQDNMTLSPPRRRHSVTFGELRPYASTCGSSSGGGVGVDGLQTPLSDASRPGSRQSYRRRSYSGTSSFHSVMEETTPASSSAEAPKQVAPGGAPDLRPRESAAIEKILDAFSGLDSCVDGRLPKEDFGQVLRALEPEFWTDDAVSMLLSAMSVDASGHLDLAEALRWLFCG